MRLSLFSLLIVCFAAVLATGFTACSAKKQDTTAESNHEYLWADIQRDWLQTQYGPCLKLAGLRMSCGGCPAIMLDVEFVTDQTGGLKSTRVLRENVCGKQASPALRRCFLKFFQNNKFPKPLRGRTLKGKLGTGLAC